MKKRLYNFQWKYYILQRITNSHELLPLTVDDMCCFKSPGNFSFPWQMKLKLKEILIYITYCIIIDKVIDSLSSPFQPLTVKTTGLECDRTSEKSKRGSSSCKLAWETLPRSLNGASRYKEHSVRKKDILQKRGFSHLAL